MFPSVGIEQLNWIVEAAVALLRDPQKAGWCLYLPTYLSSQVRVRLQGGFAALSPPPAPFTGIYISLNLAWLI